MASAVSTTRQTTTAAISIGLPSWSLTFSLLLSKLRMRSDTRRRVVSGFTHQKPCSLSEPLYVRTAGPPCAWFGFTTVSPAKQIDRNDQQHAAQAGSAGRPLLACATDEHDDCRDHDRREQEQHEPAGNVLDLFFAQHLMTSSFTDIKMISL